MRNPEPVPEELRGRAVTLHHLHDAGVAPSRVRARDFAPLYRGVYLAPGASPDLLTRCTGLAAVLPPEARFSHVTAARLYGAPLPLRLGPSGAAMPDPAELHVTVPVGTTVPRRRPGVVTHQRLSADVPRLVGGVAVSSPEQTFVDLATVLPLSDLVALGDYFVRDLIPRTDLIDHVRTARARTRGIVRARRAAALVREGVDSAPESHLRLIIVHAGLPEPEVNPTVYSNDGEWLGQPDLAHRRQRVASQYDGDVHRTSRRRWLQDIARDEAFRDSGWVVLRATSYDLARPRRYLNRLSHYLDVRAI